MPAVPAGVLTGFRRITRDGRWIPEIDALRFIAIFSVLFFHLHGELILRAGRTVPVQDRYSWFAHLLSHGYRGVPLFFVISGFILGLPFARQWLQQGRPVHLGKYFLRRVTRLEPPYILSYVVAILLWGVYTRGTGITGIYVQHLVAGIFYLNTLIFHGANPVNSVTWSLEIEIQFYILVPLLAMFFRIRNPVVRRGLLIAAIAACGVVQAIWMQDSYTMQRSIVFYLQYFLAGFLLADLYLAGIARFAGWWEALAVLGWAVYFYLPKSTWAHGLFPFLLLGLCAVALRGHYLRFFFSNTTVAVIGGMCYSIYLLHFLLIAVVFKATRHLIIPQDYLLTFLVQVLCTALPVVAICALYYRWIERPCMDPEWPAKLWRRLRPSHVAAS